MSLSLQDNILVPVPVFCSMATHLACVHLHLAGIYNQGLMNKVPCKTKDAK